MKIGKKYFLVTFFLSLILIPNEIFAIELNKTTFDYNETIYFVGSGGPWVIYDTQSGIAQGGRGSYSDQEDLSIGLTSGKTYSIIETTVDAVCEDNGYDYSQCKSAPEFVDEFVFNINAAPYGGGSVDPITVPSVVNTNQNFTPVCGAGVAFFDVIGLYSPQLCGQSINSGPYGGMTYEVRAFDVSFNYMSPSAFFSTPAYSAPEEDKKRIIPQVPLVSIFSPKLNSVFSNSILIDYSVVDPNDSGSDEEKLNQGMKRNPVSLYYTDKNFDWAISSALLVSPEYKTLIVDNQPAVGQYKWTPTDLVPGVLYRIIVDATDNGNLTGESVSDYFSVDFIPPVFKVKTNPTMIKTGDVRIFVESSEDLQATPTLKVIQKDGPITDVKMSKNDDIYEGIYTIKSGYDGTARIEVQGTDMAGNVGSEIISGGTFSVGVNPPPKPKIYTDSSKLIVNEEYFNVRGSAREDTEVILNLNGKSISTLKPDIKGNFSFEKIKLEKIKNKGVNHISIVSRDSFGTISESTDLEIKYNIAPKVTIISPAVGSLLSNQADFIAKASDENLDTLFYSFDIISSSDFNSAKDKDNWISIASDIAGGNIKYDTTEIDDGDYLVRVVVSDGYAVSTSTNVSFSVKNTLPYFRFEDGRKTITNNTEVTINGKTLIPSSITDSITIKSISYSLDGGSKWITINGDVISSKEQKFSVILKDLTEGTHVILWRMKDSRDVISKGSHTVIIDKKVPQQPVIKFPKNDVIITDADDENLKKYGVQVSIRGNAEAGSTVIMQFNGNILKTKVSLLGEFSFKDVTFDKIGKQDLQFTAIDVAGNKSTTTSLMVTYNNPPIITVVNPKPFRGLSGKATISWNIVDPDKDSINNVEISYASTDGTYKTIVKNVKAKSTFVWDTSKLLEGSDYKLKITARDSLSQSSSVTSFVIDRTIPVLSSFIIQKGDVNKKIKFIGMGNAYDALSGIEYVEYSISAVNSEEMNLWYKATILSGYLNKQATFEIKYSSDLPDDSYIIYARAVDAAGNISNELSQKIFIDRTAPRIGSFFITDGNNKIVPDQDGNIAYYKNKNFDIAVSMENDVTNASLTVGEKKIKLIKNINSGLWTTTLSFTEDTTKEIFVTAGDSSGNITKNKKIGILSLINGGKVFVKDKNVENPINDANFYVFKLNDSTGEYDRYIPNQTNIKTDKNGLYDLVLPAGNYRFEIVKSGFKVIKKEVKISRTKIYNDDIEMISISGVQKIFTDLINKWSY